MNAEPGTNLKPVGGAFPRQRRGICLWHDQPCVTQTMIRQAGMPALRAMIILIWMMGRLFYLTPYIPFRVNPSPQSVADPARGGGEGDQRGRGLSGELAQMRQLQETPQFIGTEIHPAPALF